MHRRPHRASSRRWPGQGSAFAWPGSSFLGQHRSFDGLRRLDEFLRRVPVAVAFEEELRADYALAIHDEGPRIGDALRLPFGHLVADMVGVDRLAPGVRE